MPGPEKDDIDESVKKMRQDLAALQQRIRQMKKRRDERVSEMSRKKGGKSGDQKPRK